MAFPAETVALHTLCTYTQPFLTGFTPRLHQGVYTKTPPLLKIQGGQRAGLPGQVLVHGSSRSSGQHQHHEPTTTFNNHNEPEPVWDSWWGRELVTQASVADGALAFRARWEFLTIVFSSMYPASTGWENQNIISRSEVWNEGIRRQVCGYIEDVNYFNTVRSS